MTRLSTGIECVLFDLDGTLIDTAADFEQVLSILTDESGISRVTSQSIHNTVSDGARALIRLAFAIDDQHETFESLLQRLLDLYYLQLENTQAKAYPGMMNLLAQLDESNIPWGVVTNKPEKFTLRLLKNLGLLARCGVVICPEHVSNRKPHPEPLLLACEKLQCDTARTVYIGDHIRDVQAAKNADIIAVAAAYGYLGENSRVEDWRADFVIRSSEEALGLMEKLRFA
jgi:N-acetyl-D-muramate 6-phosphate phosphatase